MLDFHCAKHVIDRDTALITPGAIKDPSTDGASGSIEMDPFHTDIIREEFLSLLAYQNYSYIILDFSNIEYVDSSCLWSLFELHRRMEDRGGTLIFLDVQPEVMRTFEYVKYNERMKIMDSYCDAIEFLYKEKQKALAVA